VISDLFMNIFLTENTTELCANLNHG